MKIRISPKLIQFIIKKLNSKNFLFIRVTMQKNKKIEEVKPNGKKYIQSKIKPMKSTGIF